MDEIIPESHRKIGIPYRFSKETIIYDTLKYGIL